MFVLTVSKKRAMRAALIILAVFVGVAVGIAAVLTSINTGAAETKLPIYSVERPDNKISLTFDCAWGNSNTDELLEILEEHNVKATFFVTGEFAEKYPDDIRKIHAAGHEIQNHSDAHPRLKGININDLINDTREAERKITMLTGEKPTLYRAPYGEYDENAVTTVEGLGYKFIQWSVDSIDWQEPDPATIVKRVVDKTAPGSILLFHNDLDNTAQALPEVLTKLRQKGYEFVKTSDLIYHEDYSIDHAGRQIKEVKVIVPSAQAGAEVPEGDEGSSGTGALSALQDPLVAGAVSVIAERLTEEEILSLRDGITAEVYGKLSEYLSAGQLEALAGLSDSDIDAIVALLTYDGVYDSDMYDDMNRYDSDMGETDYYSEEYGIINDDYEQWEGHGELIEYEKG